MRKVDISRLAVRLIARHNFSGLGRMNRYVASTKGRRELSSITALAEIFLASVSLALCSMTLHSGDI